MKNKPKKTCVSDAFVAIESATVCACARFISFYLWFKGVFKCICTEITNNNSANLNKNLHCWRLLCPDMNLGVQHEHTNMYTCITQMGCNRVWCYRNAAKHSIWNSLLCNILQKLITKHVRKNTYLFPSWLESWLHPRTSTYNDLIGK